MRGVEGGFTQAGHGKGNGLKRLKDGDWIVFYSPKTAYQDGETLQAFTAIGRIVSDDIYQGEMTPDFHPWRKDVKFYKSTEASIKPLLEELSFIQDKTHWGYMFRFGLFKIPDEDFEIIKAAMKLTD